VLDLDLGVASSASPSPAAGWQTAVGQSCRESHHLHGKGFSGIADLVGTALCCLTSAENRMERTQQGHPRAGVSGGGKAEEISEYLK